MDTVRVDICYRPLRIGWAINSGDFEGFRKAVKYSHALWGGRFNPIFLIDREGVSDLVELFRPDFIVPIDENDASAEFLSAYPHLIYPFMSRGFFSAGDEYSRPSSMVLDIRNTFAHYRDSPDWKAMLDFGVKTFRWSEDDPLTDAFLMTLGAYPSSGEVGTDYLEEFERSTSSERIEISRDNPIPVESTTQPSISYISRYALERHYSIRSGWSHPGFFVGDVTNLEDLVDYWNLRACDIPLQFIDPSHSDRYSDMLPSWAEAMRARVANYRDEHERRIAVWSSSYEIKEAGKAIGEPNLVHCSVSPSLWNGMNVAAPMMYFGEASSLGVLSDRETSPRVSFSLSDKPFYSDIWFHQQHLVASISMIGGLHDNDQCTFKPAYLPELNEFYARKMFLQYNKLRIEPERIGLIIDAADHDAFLGALPTNELIEKMFELAGYEAKASAAGLIAKQLISRVGGLQGCRVFKVPGVRRLFKSHGLNSSITKKVALQDIGAKDPDRPDASFNDHKDLYIEARPFDGELTPPDVFSYLVAKNLFRIGADLKCPSCNLTSWVAMDQLSHEVTCELCGISFDSTRQLTDSNSWQYRRSGIMGVEKNSQGAVPVALTLQQLDTTFHDSMSGSSYSTSLDLKPKENKAGAVCETDFVWVTNSRRTRKTAVVIGECKDSLPFDINDVENLKAVADAFPANRFDIYILFSKLVSFTDEEIAHAKTLNDRFTRRVILLTHRELEPYFANEHWRDAERTKRLNWFSPEEMAQSTAAIYFDGD